MNIQQWLLARREGRLSALPLGMSVAMTSSCDVFSVARVHGNDDGDDFGNRDHENMSMYELRNKNGNGSGDGNAIENGNGYGDGFGHVNYRYPLLAFARREVAASGFTENCFLAED